MTRRRRYWVQLWRWLPRARLISGLILLAFVLLHLLNHALGLVSLNAAEVGREWFLALWRNPVGSTALYGGLFVHVLAAFVALFRRRTLRMAVGEGVQITLGLVIPLLIAVHVVATRGVHEVYGVQDTYAFVVLSLWVWEPWQGLLQAIALLVVWGHGILGLHFWWRLKPNYPRWRTTLFVCALLVPAASLAGFASAGQQVALLMRDGHWLARQLEIINMPQDAVAWVYSTAGNVRWSVLIAVGLLLSVHLLRWLWRRRGQRVAITYPDGRSVTVPTGTTVLEASRIGDIPHASVCGGRGRCSTCRVRLVSGAEQVSPPSREELQVLRRVRAADSVRLACQLRPTADVAVVPLLEPTAGPRDGFRQPAYLQGSEREIAVLFADLRAFTKFSESKLPFDVVFALNQYFRVMGEAVEKSGGRLDKFIGDGVMALFGIQRGVDLGCQNALRAAQEMSLALERLNQQLAQDLEQPFRMGIGIHAGPAIVGEMGYRHAVSVTAVGDTVNTASRLEALTKEFGAQLVVSMDVVNRAGLDMAEYETRDVAIRGRDAGLPVVLVPDARTLVLPADSTAGRRGDAAKPVEGAPAAGL